MKASSNCRLLLSVGIFALSLLSSTHSQDPPAPQPAPPTGSEASPALEVEQLGGSLHALGDIRFDSAKRTLTFPATVNMDEGAVEFALVGTQGKTHESVFATEIRPVHLRAVFSLMNLEPVPLSPADPEATPALVQVHVSWVAGDSARTGDSEGTPRRVSLRECVLVMDVETRPGQEEKVDWKPLPEGSWAYTGSRFDAQGFEAERELDFIGVQHRPSALLNLPHPQNDRDDLWRANDRVLPPIGTPVTLEITLPDR